MDKMYKDLTNMIDTIKRKEKEGLIANSSYVNGYIDAIMDVFKIMSTDENLERDYDNNKILKPIK